MAELFYDLNNIERLPSVPPVRLPSTLRLSKERPENYLPDTGLADAFRTMLLLRRPLLITGEPGTGKTQAAHYLNWKLGYGERALRFDAKSTSTARDLFYTYNTLGRFQAAQTKDGSQDSVAYIQYNALGMAILRAIPHSNLAGYLPSGFSHPGNPTQSVVLIDEVDKAPRDFPNDLLNELENMSFRVPELSNREFTAEDSFLPVVIVTSNSEKNLPAAFLRRCVYYHIPKPDKKQFELVLKARLGDYPNSQLMKDALDFLMYSRRAELELTKRPATAEFLDFVLVLLQRGATKDQSFNRIPDIVKASLGSLIKSEDEPNKIFEQWLKK